MTRAAQSVRILLLAGLIPFSTSLSASFSIQAPSYRAEGPLAASASSYPFGAADHARTPSDLKAVGYVEEEFLFSGVANVYDWPAPGPAVVRTADAPYTTRVLVRRPADRSRFSGTVVVEMLNPSNLFDLNIGWAISNAQFIRNGDAWVGITAKPVAVASLKAFNASRYGALSWANPLEANDPENCDTVARDSDRATENGLVWDIHRQAGQWLRGRGGNNPFTYGTTTGAHPVARLYAWGYSQTGGYLYTYVNAIHPLDVKQFGKPLFDAYFIAVASGPSPINQCAAPIPAGDPRRVIKNAVHQEWPVLHETQHVFLPNCATAARQVTLQASISILGLSGVLPRKAVKNFARACCAARDKERIRV